MPTLSNLNPLAGAAALAPGPGHAGGLLAAAPALAGQNGFCAPAPGQPGGPGGSHGGAGFCADSSQFGPAFGLPVVGPVMGSFQPTHAAVQLGTASTASPVQPTPAFLHATPGHALTPPRLAEAASSHGSPDCHELAVHWGQLEAQAKDPKGSRFLQNELPKMSEAHLESVRDELAPQLAQLALHSFGNYLVSALTKLPLMHAPLCDAFDGLVLRLLMHAQGSRVIQSAVVAFPPDLRDRLATELTGHICEVSQSVHGSWGVCALFKHTHAPHILAEVGCSIYSLSMQQHGCRVVQSVLQEASEAGLDLGPPTAALLAGDLESLSMHPFGNYAVQVRVPSSCTARAHSVPPLRPAPHPPAPHPRPAPPAYGPHRRSRSSTSFRSSAR